jgi:1-aminocyclopropane-1-carboxylate deaminase/D-cysteine desulfhydrase-like pyridoxal-dependent ACC family enzyme
MSAAVLDKLPRRTFAHLPTPLQPAPKLAIALGVRTPLWVKRDDLTGPGLGGNKVRKLEYLLADAAEQGADCVVTVGAAQSKAALTPLERRGILEGEEPIVFLHTGGQPALFTDRYANEVLRRGSE